MTVSNLSEIKESIKDIPGFEGRYAITKNGDVWSYPKRQNGYKGFWKKNQITTNNRKRIKPRSHFTIGLGRKTYQVHRLVALTYLPNPKNLPSINHVDGNPLNNRVNNLEWVSHSENMRHAIKNGLFNPLSGKQQLNRSKIGRVTGPKNGKVNRKFSIEEARNIQLINIVGKKSRLSISKVYDCSSKTIDNICNGKTYKEIQEILL